MSPSPGPAWRAASHAAPRSPHLGIVVVYGGKFGYMLIGCVLCTTLVLRLKVKLNIYLSYKETFYTPCIMNVQKVLSKFHNIYAIYKWTRLLEHKVSFFIYLLRGVIGLQNAGGLNE